MPPTESPDPGPPPSPLGCLVMAVVVLLIAAAVWWLNPAWPFGWTP
jgi:hypothetical protein